MMKENGDTRQIVWRYFDGHVHFCFGVVAFKGPALGEELVEIQIVEQIDTLDKESLKSRSYENIYWLIERQILFRTQLRIVKVQS